MCLFFKPKKFTIKLADISISVQSNYKSTRFFCKDYVTDDDPTEFITLTKKDIEQERELYNKQMLLEGQKFHVYSKRYYETLALCRKIMDQLLKHDIILFHGSVIAKDGKAYVFTAKSGTGKTTHCNLWLNNIPDCHILNGDKPFLKFEDNQIFACGTPWMGKEKFGINETLPVEAICIIEQNEDNFIEPIELGNELNMLIGQCHIPSGNNSLVSVLKLLDKLSSVKLFKLKCNMDKEAAFVSYNAMTK